MLTFTTNVSRKTPLDGRLEIPPSLADRLISSGDPLSITLGGVEQPVRVEAMRCSCAKGASNGHEHHFLAAESLRSLVPDSRVSLLVDLEAGRIEIDATP